MAMGRGFAAAVKFTGSAGGISAEWQHPDFGVISSRLPGSSTRDFEIGFQHRYVMDALNAIKSPTIQMLTVSEGYGPAIITGTAELADPNTTLVLMPMRI